MGKNKYEIRKDVESQKIKLCTKSFLTVANAVLISISRHRYNAATDANSKAVGVNISLSFCI